jgi:CubicO group peptidase (beta-lactamase class C family)
MKNLFLRTLTKALAITSLMLFPFLIWAQKKSNTPPSEAIYTTLEASKYMRKWWLLGPIPVSEDSSKVLDEATQQKFFEEDPAFVTSLPLGKEKTNVQINGKQFHWKLHTSGNDIIDLDGLYKKDYSKVYAAAEIIADSAHNTYLAIGSDDGVKVWVNNKLVHNNWVPRGVVPDHDRVSIPLVKGKNLILIVVQDMSLGWGFVVRLLDKAALGERLITQAGQGNLDEVNELLLAGGDINKKNEAGLSAWNAARLFGREEVATLLKQNGAQQEAMPAPEKLMDHLYHSSSTKVAPAAAVLVSKNGNIIYKKAFGYADIEKKTKATPETKFRIGSITKQFTAAAILKLQEENKLQVTDKLSKFLPDFPRAEEVTIHHLLTHTSGIHSYTSKEDFVKRAGSYISTAELIDFFKNDPYDFNPGEQYRYNNSAYFLLGYIVEKASGKGYSQYLKDTFFDPLGMKNSGVHASTLKLKNEAIGHTKAGENYEKAPNWDMSWAGGAGAIYSTVGDLFIWNEALYNGKVLKEESLSAALTSVKLNNGKTPPDGEYGYGLVLRKYRDLSIAEHGGGLYGFISNLVRYQKDKLTVVILNNISPAEANMNGNTVAQFYLWETMAPQPSVTQKTIAGQDLKAYEGRYDFRNGAIMTITSEGDALFAQLSFQQKFPIFSSAPDEFFWKVVDARIKFTRNEKGEVTGGHFVQSGNPIDVVKLQEEKIISVDPAIYKNYTGKYDYGNNFHITVTAESNKIFAQGTNQPKLEIFPVSDKEFIIRDVNARILFVPGPDGKVNKLNLDMGGQKKDAPKIE